MLRAALASAALAALAAPRGAAAFDAEVRGDTFAQAYQIRGPAGSPVLSTRRVSQSLTLNVYDRPRDPRGVTVLFRLRLRLDADFGDACDPISERCYDEANRETRGDFQPLFARRTMDLQYAYLDLANLGRGALDVRLGRIFQTDPLGFFLYDGARARLRILDVAVLEAFGGLETRAGFPISNGRFERDGPIRGDRGGWDPALAPYVQHREFAPVIGAAIETGTRVDPVFARVVYRRVWTGSAVSEEKIGAQLDARLSPNVRAYGTVVYSLPERLLAQLVLAGEWTDRRGALVGLELSRYRPTFDLTSIWSSFWIDPTDEARAYGELPLSPRVSLVGSWLVRRYPLSESGPSTNGVTAQDLWNTGGGAGLLVRTPAWQATLRARAEGGAIGARGGVDATWYWWAVPAILRLDARLSAWQVVDELRPTRTGPSFGVVAGATLRLGRIAELYTDVEDDINPVVGQRFRLMAVLTIRGPF